MIKINFCWQLRSLVVKKLSHGSVTPGLKAAFMLFQTVIYVSANHPDLFWRDWVKTSIRLTIAASIQTIIQWFIDLPIQSFAFILVIGRNQNFIVEFRKCILSCPVTVWSLFICCSLTIFMKPDQSTRYFTNHTKKGTVLSFIFDKNKGHFHIPGVNNSNLFYPI